MQQQQSDDGGAGPSSASGSLSLPLTIRHTDLPTLHDDTLALMSFAARLNFSVFEGEIDEKIATFWSQFVRQFFVCPDLAPGGGGDAAAADADDDAMDVADGGGVGGGGGGPKTKPLLVVAAGLEEEPATRDARPPEQRWSMPLTYPKTSHQLFLGNSHFYIFARLYHIILMRLDAARGMCAEAQAAGAATEAEAANGADGKGADGKVSATNGIAASAAGSASAEHATRASLIASVRADAKGDLYLAFMTCLKQVLEGKMEAGTYEDVLRTLLGTNAYLLFTLHKLVSQALKQLQMLLVEETSGKLLELYEYERQRAAAGAMSEATYRSNARLVLEGDDCFRLEQLYCAGDFVSGANGSAPPEEGTGGALVLAFLPEVEEDDEDDVEVEEEDDEEEGNETGKAETVEYMRSFMRCSRAPSLPPRSKRGLLLRKSAMRPPVWGKALLRHGLECRSAVGSRKLRFVSRSEDLWLANTKRLAAKRAAAASIPGGSSAKRRKLAVLLEERLGRDGPNALVGQPAATPAPLPRAHTFKQS